MPLAFWLGYLYEHSLVTEAALDLVHEDILALAERVEAIEHNQMVRAVQLIMPQGNA